MPWIVAMRAAPPFAGMNGGCAVVGGCTGAEGEGCVVIHGHETRSILVGRDDVQSWNRAWIEQTP